MIERLGSACVFALGLLMAASVTFAVEDFALVGVSWRATWAVASMLSLISAACFYVAVRMWPRRGRTGDGIGTP